MSLIQPFGPDHEEYRRDESRSVGEAATISFPTCEDDVRTVLRELYPQRVPVTVQGGRTGLAAGAVPHGGHVLNLTKMNRYLGLRRGEDGTFYLRVQPGLVLSQLRKDLEDKNVPTAGWDEASLAAWEELKAAPEHIFPTDPTEISACMGGIVACNASGARSFCYGAARPHVQGLRVVLSDGDALELQRGQVFADGLKLELVTEGGRTLELDVPGYAMPHTKNASGYYAAPNMDAVDLFVGSDGTLGVITQIEVALREAPAVTWGVSCFFAAESDALSFTEEVREKLARAEDAPACVVSLEYFDAGALAILRRQKATSAAFAGLQPVPERFGCCVYVELAAQSEAKTLEALYQLGGLLDSCGGSEGDTWVARTALDREAQRFFRHAVPESTNMLIDERRKADPTITKLGSDMSVPDEHLRDVVALYRRTLAEEGLETAVWGHIGNNHLHVNVLPRDAADYARGKALYQRWAAEVTAMGGAVSAEHGVGKLKRGFLATMYGDEAIAQMARLKLQLDPTGVLGRGNLFPEELLDAPAATNPREA